MKVMVTGHRPQRIPDGLTSWVISELGLTIDKLVTMHGMDYGITGMQRGVDLWYAQLLIERDIPYHAFIPWPEWDKRWFGEYRRAHEYARKHADEVTYCAQAYYQGVYWRRNQLMVDACDMGIAVWDGSPNGGTFDAMDRLARAGKPYVLIDMLRKEVLMRKPREREEVASQ